MICRNGDSYVLSGHKWWTSGAPDPRCKIAIFMGKRPLNVYGYDDAPHGHAEVVFKVNVSNVVVLFGYVKVKVFLQ